MLQVSFPWQGRALPLYRLVFDYRGPEVGQKEQVRTASAFLRAHLPAPLGRYVLVMDRGFPSNVLIRELDEADWRFVLRIKGEVSGRQRGRWRSTERGCGSRASFAT